MVLWLNLSHIDCWKERSFSSYYLYKKLRAFRVDLVSRTEFDLQATASRALVREFNAQYCAATKWRLLKQLCSMLAITPLNWTMYHRWSCQCVPAGSAIILCFFCITQTTCHHTRSPVRDKLVLFGESQFKFARAWIWATIIQGNSCHLYVCSFCRRTSINCPRRFCLELIS